MTSALRLRRQLALRKRCAAFAVWTYHGMALCSIATVLALIAGVL